MQDNNNYDIVIIGGGLVGNSVVCALQQYPQYCKKLRIAVVEAVPATEKLQTDFDVRSVALSYGSSLIFQRFKIWQKMLLQASPINNIHISTRGNFGSANVKAEQQKVPALGYVVAMPVLLKAFYDKFSEFDNVDLLCPATVSNIERIATGHQLTLIQDGNNKQINAKLIIVADGTRSKTRDLLHINTKQTDYGQYGVTANIGLADDHQNYAYERFTATGPLAMLPMTERRAAMVWCVSENQAAELKAADDVTFLKSLQETFGYRLGQLQQVGVKQIYPLRLTQAMELSRPGIVLLGNVAQTLHPVAGQGFNLGLRSAVKLAEVIIDALRNQQDYASNQVLKNYESQQLQDRATITLYTNFLVKLFSNNVPMLGYLRGKGLLALDLLPFSKQPLIKMNMGVANQIMAEYL